MNIRKLKHALYYPYSAWQRHRHRHLPREERQYFEVYNYSPDILKFAAALSADDILHTGNLSSDSIVVDLGGFKGDWTGAVYQKYQPTIHVFEPMPKAVARLNKRFELVSKIRVYPYGASNQNVVAPMVLRGPGSSVVPSIVRPDKDRKSVDVELRDIKEIFHSLALHKVDLIKINIEGGEYPVLRRMIECDVIRRCGELLIQFHEWYPDSLGARRLIHRDLRSTHRLAWNYPFIWEKWTAV